MSNSFLKSTLVLACILSLTNASTEQTNRPDSGITLNINAAKIIANVSSALYGI